MVNKKFLKILKLQYNGPDTLVGGECPKKKDKCRTFWQIKVFKCIKNDVGEHCGGFQNKFNVM